LKRIVSASLISLTDTAGSNLFDLVFIDETAAFPVFAAAAGFLVFAAEGFLVGFSDVVVGSDIAGSNLFDLVFIDDTAAFPVFAAAAAFPVFRLVDAVFLGIQSRNTKETKQGFILSTRCGTCKIN
jgi:hypothetical protein